MIIARDSSGKMINIIDSSVDKDYYCPICKEKLIRNFGLERQYFSHPKGISDDCEIKMKLFVKEHSEELELDDLEILKQEYYNKEFSNVSVEMSDYISEEGYSLTQEQKDIIFSKEDRIKISALAGSSKTTTLYYYAKERPFKKILYIVYNKAMKTESEKTFGKLRNVEIKTIHGLAYKYFGRMYSHKLTFNYNAIDVLKDLKLNFNTQQELAVKVYEMMKEYMLSNVETFDELDMYKEGDNEKDRPRIINLCEKLWELKKDCNSKAKIEHDFYLKLFQLEKKNLSRSYDIILVDEVQDGSLLLLDILNNSKVKGIAIVGDTFQSLYMWRKSQNIIPLFDGKEYKLTTSFRISQQTANIANLLVYDVKEVDIDMKGFNTKQKIVDNIDKKEPYVCLCRTNSNMFQEVIDAIDNGKKRLYFEGGYKGYNFENLRDAYSFSIGIETTNPIFKKFKDYYQMEVYAKKSQDLELLSLTRMVDKYGSRIPRLIENIKYCVVKDKENADVSFSTIHRSKGMTYAMPVVVSEDHMDIEKLFEYKFINGTNSKDAKELEKQFEEMCIIYVAITRASKSLYLSETLKKYLITRYKWLQE